MGLRPECKLGISAEIEQEGTKETEKCENPLMIVTYFSKMKHNPQWFPARLFYSAIDLENSKPLKSSIYHPSLFSPFPPVHLPTDQIPIASKALPK